MGLEYIVVETGYNRFRILVRRMTTSSQRELPRGSSMVLNGKLYHMELWVNILTYRVSKT